MSKVLDILNKDHQGCQHTARAVNKYLKQAAQEGETYAMYLLWKANHSYRVAKPHTKHDGKRYPHSQVLQHSENNSTQKGGGYSLAPVRDLRAIIHQVKQSSGGQTLHVMQLELCKLLCINRLTIGPQMEGNMATVREFFGTSEAMNVNKIYQSNPNLNHKLRFILIDWLFEVAMLKTFSAYMLHTAVGIIDRFLKQRYILKSDLQLVGISAMLLVSRMFHGEVIGVEEAVWFTDSTYNASQVIHMTADITSALRGKFIHKTTMDYTNLLLDILQQNSTRDIRHLVQYIADLTLQQSDLTDFTRGRLAACCVFLARLEMAVRNHSSLGGDSAIEHLRSSWPIELVDHTGYTIQQLLVPTWQLYESCFSGQEGVVKDNKGVVLEATRLRHVQLNNMDDSVLHMMDRKTIDALISSHFSTETFM